MFSKDISPKINGKLKDECAYIVNLLERIINSAALSKPNEEDYYDDDEIVELETLNPQNTALVNTYLKLCK